MVATNQQEHTYTYYLYHHLYISHGERDRIIKTIMEHDFDNFLQFYLWYQKNSLNNPHGFVFFPDTITVYDKERGEYLEGISVLDKNNFNKIEFAKCECG